jgi:hypothetical protein
LYLFGGLSPNKTLWALDINSNTIVGSLDISDIMGSGIIAFVGNRALNPVTGELVFTNLHYDAFVVVNGPAMTGAKISVADSRGRGGTWNPQENKIYITTIDWNGYFIYDRDSGTSTTTPCINDGTLLFYSQASNRIYSGAEINWDTTVIEGATDACQNVEIAGGLADVGFINATHHAYFAGADQVKVLDEDSLTVVSTIPGCRPDAYGGVDTQVIVSQQRGRVYVRSYWSNPTEGNCILVIEEPLPIPRIVDFNGDGQEDILWRYYGSGGHNRAWFLGDSGGGASPVKTSDTPMLVGPADRLPSGEEVARMAFSDRRDRGKDAVRRGKPELKGPGGVMDVMKTRTTTPAVVDDPRKAGRGIFKPSLMGFADPRQVKHTLDRETSTGALPELAAAPVLLGGADVMPVGDLNWQIVGTGHFNDDTHVDIVWRNISSGMNVVWFMNGAEWTASAELLPVGDLNWKIVGTGDFDNDTHVDILWRNGSNGANVVWYMDGTTWKSSAVLLGVSDVDWQIVGTGDFNEDGNVDILWRYNGAGGYNVVWYLNNAAWTGSAELISVGDLAWQIMGTGDYNNDGSVDILWRYNGAGGYNYIWYMDGVTWIGGGDLLPVADLTWKIVSR